MLDRPELYDALYMLAAGDGRAIYSTLVDTGGARVALYNVPTFIKLRLREGEPLDAKIYLQAGAVA